MSTKEKAQKNLSPIEIKINRWIVDHLSRVKTTQKILFISNMKTMVKAGLSLVEALNILSSEVENKKLQNIILNIKNGVEQGKQLSEVLANYPKIFPQIYVSMISAGERAGKLEEALEQVTIQMKKSHELASTIRGALMYPAVIVVAMVGISIEVVFFVLPKLMVMFEEVDVELPLATRVLIAITKFGQNYGIYLLIGSIPFCLFVVWLVKKPKIKKLTVRLIED